MFLPFIFENREGPAKTASAFYFPRTDSPSAQALFRENRTNLTDRIYFTSTTQLVEPKGLVTYPQAFGSFSQRPSTQNLYSYLPGLRAILTDQLFPAAFLRGVA